MVVEIFSTIASPVFSELVIVLERGLAYRVPLLEEMLRKLHEARPFKLVLLIEASGPRQERLLRESAKALDFGTANGFYDFLNSPPTLRVAQPRYSRWGSPHFY